MIIYAVIGSMRKYGSTYMAVKRIEEELEKLDTGLEFGYVFLGDEDISLCKGCGRCFREGEANCPCKDSVPEVVRKMSCADGMIFAFPTYVADVSGIMKNFIDRLAYFCHRPAFFGKKALLVTTVGISGAGRALNSMDLAASIWGFQITGKLSIITGTNSIASVPERYDAALYNAAKKFYWQTSEGKKPRPDIKSLTVFKYRKKYYKRYSSTYDAEYWRSKGWLESGKNYFCDADMNVLNNMIAWVIAGVVWLATPKPGT